MCVHRIGPFQLVTESVFDGRFLCIEEFTEQQVVETGRVLQLIILNMNIYPTKTDHFLTVSMQRQQIQVKN